MFKRKVSAAYSAVYSPDLELNVPVSRFTPHVLITSTDECLIPASKVASFIPCLAIRSAR
jgi:hypothetical protein